MSTNEFQQRLECPDISNKWYRKDAGNPCLFGNSSESHTNSSVLPNCVGYAFGRFSEIMGTWANSCFNKNAGPDMWNACKAVYETGQVPQLGAAIIWTPQHVGIVEQINDDGSIIVSESGWGASWLNRFWTSKCTKESGYTYPCSYVTSTLGFVYNPAVAKDASVSNISMGNEEHPANRFVKEAESHVGSAGHAWVQSMTTIGNQAWCAATCCAVAKACGFAGVIMPERQYTASGFGKSIIEDYGGTYIPGPVMGDTEALPQPGDIILYTNDYSSGTYNRGTKYSAYHVGIVKEVIGDTVVTIEGNTGNGEYKINNMNRHGSEIGWYARPDWTKVGGSMSQSGIIISGDLYESESTRADALIREVAYMSTSGDISTRPIGVKLSVINYTGPLAQIIKSLGGTVVGGTSTEGSGTAIIDGLEPVPREIAQYLINKGLPASTAIGILANIQAESGFRTDAINSSSGASGLCQWLGVRKDKMIQMAGSSWMSNLTGQLDYLWWEISTGKGFTYGMSTFEQLKSLPNTLEGAKKAARIFVAASERPFTWTSDNYDDPALLSNPSVIRREGFAEALWNKVIVVGTSTITNNISNSNSGSSGQTTITTDTGQPYTAGLSKPIPSTVQQTGIIDDSIVYGLLSSVRDTSSAQYVLYQKWLNNSKPQANGIATLGGYYLVAVPPKAANIGYIISVVFNNTQGTCFNAIVADYIRNSNGSVISSTSWGLYKSGKLISLQWIVPQLPGLYDSTLKRSLMNLGFYKQPIKQFVVYGQYTEDTSTARRKGDRL